MTQKYKNISPQCAFTDTDFSIDGFEILITFSVLEFAFGFYLRAYKVFSKCDFGLFKYFQKNEEFCHNTQ